MKLNRKNLIRVVIVSFLVAILLPFVITTSITDIYSCANKVDATSSCAALDSAKWKIQLGLTLQMASWAIFITSSILYFWFRLKKKE